ncbi:pilus assembly PilX family protein [Hydrogenophaga crassostreae]|nr:hypothetical protein [Hydrogenophaga crassostreae]
MRPLRPYSRQRQRASGIVLPVALIMLVIVSFAGLIAARNSATYEQFSNNLRTNQFARQTAEAALHYCERVAISTVDTVGPQFPLVTPKIFTTAVASDDPTVVQTAEWNTKSRWAATEPNLITVTLNNSSGVQASAQTKNNPSCIVQQMAGDRFLITSRGLSNDAVVAADGSLSSGSEVWLQSVLTPGIPTVTAAHGVEQPL